ncbi:hypothetical protein C2S51_026191, partial [Perilla frutescens var. frutescens]
TRKGKELVDPEEYPNLFEDWQVVLAVEAEVSGTRGNFPPAAEYVQHADRSTTSIVEAFRTMQVEADEEHLENGGLDYDDGEPNDQVPQKEDDTQVDGHDESPEEVVVVDADSTDGAVLVNGNEAEKEWDANNDGKPSA